MTPPRFTPEQRAAVADRRGSRLLAANAGSGKTAVLVERLVEAVLVDEVPAGAILAITFTEKAAAELRERTRHRFLALDAPEAARATDTAWIGTIHGFCARVLRAAPLAAGIDPGFRVLDEAEAQRLAARAFDSALDAWAAAHGPAALDLAAAYGDALRELVLAAHASLRARGQRRPALPVPPPAAPPDPAPLHAACAAAAAHLGGAGAGKRIADGLLALEACARALDGADAAVPLPAALSAAALVRGGRALDAEPATAYRAAWAAYRRACADHHARPAVALVDALLRGFADHYEAGKRERAGLDFDDLELAVRDLFAGDVAVRRRWAERFALIMVDEFQDTNRLQLDVLEALERDNLFAVGDELQSIYAFRHADVEIFRARRATLGAAGVRRLRTNFRSAPELLAVLNGAFAPLFGDRFAPLEPGRAPVSAPAPVSDELRLFDPDAVAATAPPVELLLTDTRGWDEPELVERLGLAAPGTTPARRAEARLVAQRVREEVDAGRSLGDIVVLVRATASLRLFEAALEEQGLATFVLGGRGYWSDEQVRDGLAYLAALANPLDERALYAVLASPFCGVGSDTLIRVAEAGRHGGEGAWAALLAAATAGIPPALETGPAGARAALAGPPALGPEAAVAQALPRGASALAVEPQLAEPAPRSASPALARRAADPGPPSAGPLDLGAELAPAEWEQLARFARFFAGERTRAEREPVEALLERAIVATGYDLAVLRRRGGERRLANLRKLMRLAREHERAEGRDIRGFVAYAQGQDLAQAREGEAALEADGLDAIRLMTIHRAKGLEFPFVCVADLGRSGSTARPPLLVGDDGRVGLRLRALGSGESVPALDHEALAAELGAAEAEEEQRLLFVAATRAQDGLVLSGTADLAKPPSGIARPGGPPLDWLTPALLGPTGATTLAERAADAAGGGAGRFADATIDRPWQGRPARIRVRLNAPSTIGTVLTAAGLTPPPPAPVGEPVAPSGAAGSWLPSAHPSAHASSRLGPDGAPTPEHSRPGVLAPTTAAAAAAEHVLARLSHSALREHARCGYRFYLQRILKLAPVEPPAQPPATQRASPPGGRLDARARGTLVHLLLERLDVRRPVVPAARAVLALAAAHGLDATDADADEARAVVRAFVGSPLRERLAAATRVQREVPFAYALESGSDAARMTGVIDVLARERDDTALVVDYKTDRLAGRDPAAVAAAEYDTQRLVYTLAALRDGAPRVEVAHVFLERPDAPVLTSYAAADEPALLERLLALADDVLTGRFPVAPYPHRDLCADCPGRRALCSWPESQTLRDSRDDDADDLRRAA